MSGDYVQNRTDKEYIKELLAEVEGLNGVGITADGVAVNIVDPDTESRDIIIRLHIMPKMPQAH